MDKTKSPSTPIILVLVLLVSIVLLASIYYLYEKKLSDEPYFDMVERPGYCESEKRYISDEEFIQLAVSLRDKEVAQHGGLDAYERELINQKNNPANAGRDFDIQNPNCCRVFHGKLVKHYCGWGNFPICVKLNYQTSKAESIDGSDIGRVYFFDDCGHEKNPL